MYKGGRACNEGPGHEEVQFHWTSLHLERGNFAMLVSSRNSGASYLNRVEFHNGCLALGHANLLIPCTLGGLCIDTETCVIMSSRSNVSPLFTNTLVVEGGVFDLPG